MTRLRPGSGRRLLKTALQIGLTILTVIGIAAYMSGQLERVQAYTRQVDVGLLIVAQICFTAGYALFPITSHLALQAVGQPLPRAKVWRIYYTSTLMKYLPGGFWSLPGRAFLYQRAGLSTSKATASLLWETILMVCSAIFVSLFCVRMLAFYLPPPLVLLGVVVFVAGFAVFLLGARAPGLPRALGQLRWLRPIRTLVETPSNWLTTSQSLVIMGVFFVTWLVFGVGFTVLIYAFEPGVAPAHVGEFVGLFAGAWVVGFLVVFAPGGIGIREGLMGLGLSIVLATPLPLLIAISARLLWTIAEIIGMSAILLYGWARRDSARPAVAAPAERLTPPG